MKRLMILTTVLIGYTLAATGMAAETAMTQDEHMQWWRGARFGLFIHWGVYSIPGGEWKGKDYGKEMGGASAEWLMKSARIQKEEYREMATQFNPVKFNAEEWVSLAKAAGMKYLVITSKHHDGFCMFDTKHTDYNIMQVTSFKRDIIKELSEECKKQGLRFGVYYSQSRDWYHRGGHNGFPGTLSTEEYLEMVENHLKELLTNYGDMSILWFDTGSSDVNECNRQGAMVRELRPSTVICSRLYNYQRIPRSQWKYADFRSLPDRTVAAARVEGDAETCMTMRHNWGYDRDDNNWKPAKDLIERLVLSASRGVNFLLNVGPTPEGTFTPEEIERLKAVGKWMKINGESIYETTYSPLDFDFPWGSMTHKPGTLYLHVMKWNPEEIVFNGVTSKPTRAYFLADPERKALPVQQDANGHVTTIKVPVKAPDVNDTVIVLEFDGPVKIDKDAKGKYQWAKNTGLKQRKRKKK